MTEIRGYCFFIRFYLFQIPVALFANNSFNCIGISTAETNKEKHIDPIIPTSPHNCPNRIAKGIKIPQSNIIEDVFSPFRSQNMRTYYSN